MYPLPAQFNYQRCSIIRFVCRWYLSDASAPRRTCETVWWMVHACSFRGVMLPVCTSERYFSGLLCPLPVTDLRTREQWSGPTLMRTMMVKIRWPSGNGSKYTLLCSNMWILAGIRIKKMKLRRSDRVDGSCSVLDRLLHHKYTVFMAA